MPRLDRAMSAIRRTLWPAIDADPNSKDLRSAFTAANNCWRGPGRGAAEPRCSGRRWANGSSDCRGLERPRSPSDRPTTSDQASSIAQLAEMWPVQHRGCSSNDRSCQCRTVVRVGHDNDALSRRGKDQHVTLIADALATLHQHE